MRTCKTCGADTYKPRQRISTKYCNLVCRDADPDYWNAISNTKSKQIISKKQRQDISKGLKQYYKNNPKPKKNDLPAFRRYKADCQFTFSLKSYPTEFNFELLKEHGWYKPVNRGNNLNGVSRDHQISIRWGFNNGVDAKIISHPANCRLITQNANAAKNHKNSITFEDLLKRIEAWNKEFGGLAQLGERLVSR